MVGSTVRLALVVDVFVEVFFVEVLRLSSSPSSLSPSSLSSSSSSFLVFVEVLGLSSFFVVDGLVEVVDILVVEVVVEVFVEEDLVVVV